MEPASKRPRTEAVEVRKVVGGEGGTRCVKKFGEAFLSPPKKLMEIDWFSSDSMEIEGDEMEVERLEFFSGRKLTCYIM